MDPIFKTLKGKAALHKRTQTFAKNRQKRKRKNRSK